jgi:hypothetical protein
MPAAKPTPSVGRMDNFGYGLWPLVIINTAVILIFAASFLAIREEAEVRERFGLVWDRYAAETPRFIPRRGPVPTPPPPENAPLERGVPEVGR